MTSFEQNSQPEEDENPETPDSTFNPNEQLINPPVRNNLEKNQQAKSAEDKAAALREEIRNIHADSVRRQNAAVDNYTFLETGEDIMSFEVAVRRKIIEMLETAEENPRIRFEIHALIRKELGKLYDLKKDMESSSQRNDLQEAEFIVDEKIKIMERIRREYMPTTDELMEKQRLSQETITKKSWLSSVKNWFGR